MLEKLLKDLEKAADNTTQQSTRKIIHLIADEIRRQIIKGDITDENNNSNNNNSNSNQRLHSNSFTYGGGGSSNVSASSSMSRISNSSSASLSLPQRADTIDFYVSGTLITTTPSTLVKRINNPFVPGSYYEASLLEEIATGKIQCSRKDKNGAYFLDRNPVYFQRILDYLR